MLIKVFTDVFQHAFGLNITSLGGSGERPMESADSPGASRYARQNRYVALDEWDCMLRRNRNWPMVLRWPDMTCER